MSFEITGCIARIGEVKTYGKDFQKLEFVVTVEDGAYSQNIQFEAVKDKAESFHKFHTVGQEVTVKFNIRGRDWTNPEGVIKTFNSLQAWRIEGVQGANNETPLSQRQTHRPPQMVTICHFKPQAPHLKNAGLW